MCNVPEGRHVTIATPSLGADGVMMDQGPAWGIAARGEMMALSPTAQQMTAQQMTSVQAIGGTSLSAQVNIVQRFSFAFTANVKLKVTVHLTSKYFLLKK